MGAYTMMTDQQEDALREPCEHCGGHVALADWTRDWIDHPTRPGRKVLANLMIVQCDECAERETR